MNHNQIDINKIIPMDGAFRLLADALKIKVRPIMAVRNRLNMRRNDKAKKQAAYVSLMLKRGSK